METRARKRAAEHSKAEPSARQTQQDVAAAEQAPPAAKRTRRQQKAADLPPKPSSGTASTRSRKGKQASAAAAAATRNTPDTVNNPPGPDQAPPQAAEAAAAAAPGPAAEPPQPEQQAGQPTAEGDMDRSGRRGSKGEPTSNGGGDDERDPGDVFGRNLGAAAGSALQGLLRKLGANFDDMLPMGVSGARMKTIMAGLKQVDDESAQLTALTDLCEHLSISTEESLTTFPVEQVVPLLVQLLGAEHNPDIMLLAARALTFLADVPGLTSSIVRHGAVPAFCARLLTIEYIDLAEQSLQALEKLSHEHPGSLLQHGGLLAVLSYLDFFPSSVQRTAVATAATMCSALGPSHLPSVRDALPILCNLLQYNDEKVVDNACLALQQIADAYAHDAALLEQLQSAGLINQALQLISSADAGSAQTSVSTYFGMVRLLSTCASGYSAVAEQLLRAGIVDTLRQLLASCAMLGGSSGSVTQAGGLPVVRTPDQLLEVLTLAHELMPAVPDAATMLLADLPTHSSAAAAAAGGAGAAAAAAAPGGSRQAGSSLLAAALAPSKTSTALTEFLQADPELAMTLCQSLLPLTLQVYSSTVMACVRARCLATITKLLAVGSPQQLQQVLADLPISSFVAGLLTSRDIKAQAAAIQMAEILMAKLPQVFAGFFVKEGVAHALELLAASATEDGAPAAAGAASDAGAGGAAAAAGGAAAAAAGGSAGDGRRPSGSGAGLPPPSPPLTRSRRSSKADQGKDDGKEAAAAGAAAAAAAPPAPAAAAPAAPPALASMRAPSSNLRMAVARRASSFRQQHFQAGDEAAGLETDGLRQLRQLCSQLGKDDGTCVAGLLEALTGNSVSVFEMITSGAVSRLTEYLQGNDLPASVQKDEQLLCRLRNFTSVALAAQQPSAAASPGGSNDPAAAAAAGGGGGGAAAAAVAAASSVPLSALVRKLQGALASSEAFPVMCRGLAPSGGALGGSARSLGRSAGMSGSFSRSTLTSGLHALTQPFRLRLVRHDQENIVKEYPNNIVLIEPLANMTAIEDFLWPRVNKGTTLEALRTQAADAATAAAAAAAAAAHPGGKGAAGSSKGGAEASARARGAAGTAQQPDGGGGGGAAAATAGGPTTRRRRSSSGTDAAAAAAAPAGSRRPGPAAAASKAQPIPEPEGGGGRMTRAQAARARAEAQARAEEAAAARSRARRAAAASGGGGGSDPMSEDAHDMMSEDDLLLRDSPGSSEDPGLDMDGMDVDGAAAAAAAAGDRGHGAPPPHGDMMDDGYFDDEDDEDMDDEDDDGALDVGSMPVHDLHLADAAAAAAAAAANAATAAAAAARAAGEGSAPAAGGAGGAAAAAAAGGSGEAGGAAGRAPWSRSGSGAGTTTAAALAAVGAGPKLVFYMNDQPLPAGATVFQAIQQSVMANSEADDGMMGDEGQSGLGANGRRGQQMWDQVYTLHYRLALSADAEAAAAAAAGPAQAAVGSARAVNGSFTAGLAGVQRQGSGLAGGRRSVDGAAAAGEAAADDEADSTQWRKSPLGELLSVSLPAGLAAPASCLDILRLLQLLEVVNRLAPRLLASYELQLLSADTSGSGSASKGRRSSKSAAGAPAPPASQQMESSQQIAALAADQSHEGQMAMAHVHRDEFVSTKLGNKLAQQLKDVLSICGGSIPAWCHQLVSNNRFLFPFEVRRRYFYLTAFGLGRALHHMNQQQAAEGNGGALERDGRELRIGRLQRQKVRVSRRRILDSAVKVMEMYAKSRAVLELEYFGEVGTGLGPTLEFYTMLSHELQRRALGMWRHEDPPPAPADDEEMQEPSSQQQQQEKPAAQQKQDAIAAAAAPAGPGQQQQQGAAAPVALHQEVVSHEQASASAADYVYAPHGLFPAPVAPAQRSAGSPVVEHFRLLGRAVAKALQDNRLLDLPLNPVFFRAAMGRPLDLYDVSEVDPGLGASLERLARAAAAHAAAGGDGPLMVDGCLVDDLCLTFTLPGDGAFELCPGGADVEVDSSNLVAYIQAVVDATLGSGIEAQLQAFREGFNEVFSLQSLEVFREDEMEALLCGAGEHWSPQQLADSMKFDHGYTSQSVPVRHLLEILSELDTSDQRRFLRFVTGCPRLPPGGIAALQPRLTVVRKQPSLMPASGGPTPGTTPGNANAFGGDWSNGTPLADGDLPSVMTCANYIKLPPYSCKEIMRERLMFAIREGQGSFDLS